MPIRNTQVSTATSGTVTCLDTREDQLLILNSGLIAVLTIAMPPSPTDGQRVFIKSKGGVTLLTMTTASGTITTALSTLGGNITYSWVWNTTDTTWY